MTQPCDTLEREEDDAREDATCAPGQQTQLRHARAPSARRAALVAREEKTSKISQRRLPGEGGGVCYQQRPDDIKHLRPRHVCRRRS